MAVLHGDSLVNVQVLSWMMAVMATIRRHPSTHLLSLLFYDGCTVLHNVHNLWFGNNCSHYGMDDSDKTMEIL